MHTISDSKLYKVRVHLKLNGAEYVCEDVAQKVETTSLFRRIHKGDVKSASEKCLLHTAFQMRCSIACALYGTPRLSAHS